jgi:hypothetical protein
MSAVSDLLRQLTQTWVKKLNAAGKYKRPFTEDAKEASMFFDGEHNWMWRDSYARGEKGYNSSIAPPNFRIQVNKVFELVDIYGAVMYHRNPVRTVSVMEHPDLPPETLGIFPQPGMDPRMLPPEQQQILQMALQESQMKEQRRGTAMLLEKYLNWTPQELDLKKQGQKWVREALIKGMSVMWTEMVTLDTTSDGQTPPVRMVGSFYDTVDNFLMDPDWDNMDDILWCARKCVLPLEQVAEEYGIDEEELRKHQNNNAEVKLDREPKSKRSKGNIETTNDLVTIYKIWSKCGMGDRFKNAPKEHRGVFDQLGKYCYVVICEGMDYPLNMPPALLEQAMQGGDDGTGALPAELLAKTAWPIPFYCDHFGWPFTPLWFHWKPGYSYPISHIRPAIGELRLLNWAMSFAATRIATSCETMIAVQKAADQTIKDQILAPSEGGFKIIEISELLGRGVNDIMSVFQMPQVTKDLWDIISAVSDLFAHRTGLSELVYGYSRSSFRSASEAQIKQENVSVRPDNMANQLEDAMSLLARREALAARWLLEAEDVVPVLGPIGAIAWKQNVAGMDLISLTRDFIYRIEAGSARKPNKATRVEQMQMAVQTLGPIVSGLVSAGMVDPYNALMRDWAESLDIDPSAYLIPPPPPPPAAPPPGPPPGEQAAAGGEGTEPPPPPGPA